MFVDRPLPGVGKFGAWLSTSYTSYTNYTTLIYAS